MKSSSPKRINAMSFAIDVTLSQKSYVVFSFICAIGDFGNFFQILLINPDFDNISRCIINGTLPQADKEVVGRGFSLAFGTCD